MLDPDIEVKLDRGGDLPFTWGERLAGYRARRGMTLLDAATAIDLFVPTSTMQLSRLEHEDKVPPEDRGHSRPRRRIAALACVIYGVHPEVMDLRVEEVPAVDPVTLRREMSRWER